MKGLEVLFGALNIGDSAERGFDTFFAWIPGLIGALVILIKGRQATDQAKRDIERGKQRVEAETTSGEPTTHALAGQQPQQVG